MSITSVHVPVLAPELLRPLIGDERLEELKASAAVVREALGAQVVINVNSTASGGGVAEMLQTLLGYARGAGIDVRWVVPQAPPEFFVFTKRLHHLLHGVASEDDVLDSAGRQLYEHVTREQSVDLLAMVRSGDVVLLHDPQTAGLAQPLLAAGAKVVWRCHVGTVSTNPASERGWSFLRQYLEGVPIVVSRARYLPAWVDPARIIEIAPSIDPLSPKNVELSPAFARDVLQASGLLADRDRREGLTFTRRDGSRGRIEHAPDVLQAGPPPPPDARLVVQISRWDPLKDMSGVMESFARYVVPRTDCHLMLAGPNVTAVADDPEAGSVLQACMAQWSALPTAARARIHLACLPMNDSDENGTLVNALQTHAAVVVQKSIAEGFGLTVTEAMWKARPVLATRVGGIESQIVSGDNGVLIEDPLDLVAFADALCDLLDHPRKAEAIGARATQSVNEQFLPDRHLGQWASLVSRVLGARRPGAQA